MAETQLKVYYSSVAVNSKLNIKTKQEKIFRILDSLHIPYEKVDITQGTDNKEEMRNIVGDPTALPPKICKGNEYLGDFDAFDEAVEMENLKGFLQIE